MTNDQSIQKLRALTQVEVQRNWRYCEQDLPIELILSSPSLNWSDVELNERDYITWSAGRQAIWLNQTFVIPQDLQGYPVTGLALRLVLTWWAEDVKIFINGQFAHAGDLFDSTVRLLLNSAVVPGAEITVTIRLVSPGHDIGALMRSQCLYESLHTLDPGWVADELTILQNYLTTYAPAQLELLTNAIAEINWDTVSHQSEFTRSLSQLRQTLQSQIPPPPTQIYFLSHAHLDMAWLWTVNETWQVAQRTFTSVLNLQQEFPELTFCHSTPALYAWIQQHRPDLFTNIQQQVDARRWEIVGGMWVEPELNLIDGESIARQILYAQHYIQQQFGQLTLVAWVPDSFGFTWQLPQLLKQGGIEYFVTQKLHWNDTTKFPYGIFWWQSPDGSQILSLISPPNITGVMDTNPITITNYALDWQKQTQLTDIFWLPGVGDHGGGPTRDMIDIASRWQQSPFFPQWKFTTAVNYLQIIAQIEDNNSKGLRAARRVGAGENIFSNSSSSPDSLIYPIWNNELYLEFHRGCYTTHGDQKRWNRHCEKLLYQAELFASLATLIDGKPYPQSELEAAWKKVLFNQFHDILPGTSIPEVFIEANQAWEEVEQVSSKILTESWCAIANQISLPPPPQPDAQAIIVFNPLNWQRSEVVTISLSPSTDTTWEIYNLDGIKISYQISHPSTLLFLAEDIPSIGYRVFWLFPVSSNQSPRDTKLCSNIVVETDTKTGKRKDSENVTIENELLRVTVDSQTGDLASIFDKNSQREVLSSAGNQIQAFQDSGQYWDAWNIDPNYRTKPLPPPQLVSIQWLERGIIRSRLRVIRQLGKSQFHQDYILDRQSPLLKIATTVDWQENHVLVKAVFPLNLNADYATYEIPCAAIQRSTRPETAAEKAKWEVPALRWADISNSEYGVSLLNDCKYGYDAQPNQLNLTLLRSPTWPDPDADRGIHHFTYAIYPHSNTWQSARTVHRGYELNLPLQVLAVKGKGNREQGTGNREQGTGNREQGTGNREQKVVTAIIIVLNHYHLLVHY